MTRLFSVLLAVGSLASIVLGSGSGLQYYGRAWSVEFGYFNSTWNAAGDGGYLAFGLPTSVNGRTEFGVEGHSAFFRAGIFDIATPTASVYGRFWDGSYSSFLHVGAGIGRITGTQGGLTLSSRSEAVYTVGLGVMVGRSTYLIGRAQWTGSGFTPLEGFSIGVGSSY